MRSVLQMTAIRFLMRNMLYIKKVFDFVNALNFAKTFQVQFALSSSLQVRKKQIISSAKNY